MGVAYLLLIGSIAFVSALYGLPELDEGLIIQWAKSMSEGALPYKDMPVVYGPLLFKLNEFIFSCFGFLHFTSRIFSFLLGFSSFLLMAYSIKTFMRQSFFVSMLFPSIWLIAACTQFSESLHPGWYISLLLSLQATLALDSKLKEKSLSLGLTSGLLLGFKLHVAALSVLPLLQAFFIECRLPKFVKFLPALILSALFFIVLQVEIFKLNIYYIFPYALTIGLFFHFCNFNRSETKADFKPLGKYLLALGVVGLLIYLPAAYTYGISNMKYNMFDLPRIKYPLMNEAQHTYSDISILFWASIYLIILYINCYAKRFSSFLDVLILFVSTYLLSGTTYCIFAFVTVHLLLFMRMPLELKSRCWPLFLISSAQILHLHPIAGTQIYYASPLVWILLGIYFLEKSFDTKFERYLKNGMLLCLILICILQVPLFHKFLAGKNVFFLSTALKNSEYILVDEDSKFLVGLVKHIKQNVRPEGKVLTFPPYYSVNLLSDRRPPNFFISHSLAYVDEEKYLQILPDLMKSNMIVMFPKSSRSEDIQKEGTYDNQIYNQILSNYAEDIASRESQDSLLTYGVKIYIPKVIN